MNVLSLFDGMSCGQIALAKLGVKVDNYYASEIDKWAMKIAKKNFPNMEHIGDVTQVKASQLPEIDLLIGGSPCQGFSFAGKQLNFDDPRSALFFEFVRLLKECKPKYFLLENVRMKQEYQDVISEAVGCKPVKINSSLLCAQNRVRLYWTNIPNIEQPEDKGIVLKDILEDGVVDRDKSFCIDANYFKGGNLKSYFEKHRRQLVFSKDGLCHVGDADLSGNDSIKRVYHRDGKSPTLTTMGGGHREPKVLVVPEATKKGYTEIEDGDCFDATFINSKTRRGRNMKDKSNCLTAANYDYMRYEHPTYRKLTPLECERLQTVPDNYTEGVSNTQRYRMLGNGWTVDVISHILQEMRVERDD
jgi:site-specific DNA-cytosine methylase